MSKDALGKPVGLVTETEAIARAADDLDIDPESVTFTADERKKISHGMFKLPLNTYHQNDGGVPNIRSILTGLADLGSLTTRNPLYRALENMTRSKVVSPDKDALSYLNIIFDENKPLINQLVVAIEKHLELNNPQQAHHVTTETIEAKQRLKKELSNFIHNLTYDFFNAIRYPDSVQARALEFLVALVEQPNTLAESPIHVPDLNSLESLLRGARAQAGVLAALGRQAGWFMVTAESSNPDEVASWELLGVDFACVLPDGQVFVVDVKGSQADMERKNEAMRVPQVECQSLSIQRETLSIFRQLAQFVTAKRGEMPQAELALNYISGLTHQSDNRLEIRVSAHVPHMSAVGELSTGLNNLLIRKLNATISQHRS